MLNCRFSLIFTVGRELHGDVQLSHMDMKIEFMSVHLVILSSYFSLNCPPTRTADQPDHFLPRLPLSLCISLSLSLPLVYPFVTNRVSSVLMSEQKTQQPSFVEV